MYHDRFTREERIGMLVIALIVGAITLMSLVKLPDSIEEATSPPPASTTEQCVREKAESDTAKRESKRGRRSSTKKKKNTDETWNKRLYPTQEPIN